MALDTFKHTLSFLPVNDLLKLLTYSGNADISNLVEEQLHKHEITVLRMETTEKLDLYQTLTKVKGQIYNNSSPLLIEVSQSSLFQRTTSDNISAIIRLYSPTDYSTPRKGTGKRKSKSSGVSQELAKLGQCMRQFKMMGRLYMFIPGEVGSMDLTDNTTSSSTTTVVHASPSPTYSNSSTDTQCQYQSKADSQTGTQKEYTSQATSTQQTGIQTHTTSIKERFAEDLAWLDTISE